MSSSRDKKLNRSDVRSGVWKFIFSFVILSVVSFTAVFFFFKSYDTQLAGIDKEVENYRTLISRNGLLESQLDSIYAKMQMLDSDRSQNDNYIRNYILDNVQISNDIMKKDSSDNFKHYAVMFQKVRPLLELKSHILEASREEEIARRNLTECTDKSSQVNSRMKVDPSRKFTGRRR